MATTAAKRRLQTQAAPQLRLPAPVKVKEQATLQHPIEATDRQIDGLVYELYGLAEEEIKIVEGATR